MQTLCMSIFEETWPPEFPTPPPPARFSWYNKSLNRHGLPTYTYIYIYTHVYTSFVAGVFALALGTFGFSGPSPRPRQLYTTSYHSFIVFSCMYILLIIYCYCLVSLFNTTSYHSIWYYNIYHNNMLVMCYYVMLYCNFNTTYDNNIWTLTL